MRTQHSGFCNSRQGTDFSIGEASNGGYDTIDRDVYGRTIAVLEDLQIDGRVWCMDAAG